MKLPLFGHFGFFFLTFRMANSGIRVAEQGLGFHALTARGPGSIPVWGSKDPDTAKKIKIKKICLKMANSVESAILLPFPDLTTVCSLVFILPNLFYLETYILAFLFFCLLMCDYNICMVLLLVFFFFGHAMWHMKSLFPNQGSNSCPLNWKCVVLATRPPGKFLMIECVGCLFKSVHICCLFVFTYYLVFLYNNVP